MLSSLLMSISIPISVGMSWSNYLNKKKKNAALLSGLLDVQIRCRTKKCAVTQLHFFWGERQIFSNKDQFAIPQNSSL